MGIVKSGDVIAWEDNYRVVCLNCGDPEEAKPLTAADFEKGDIVFCINCGKRIL